MSISVWAILECTHLLVKCNNPLKETPSSIPTVKLRIHKQILMLLEILETNAPNSLLFTDEAYRVMDFLAMLLLIFDRLRGNLCGLRLALFSQH